MKIRAFLFLMALAILTPVIAFSAMSLHMLLGSQRDTALQGLQKTAYATALVVDQEMLAAEAALKVLATSPYLAAGDLASFYQQAKSADRGVGAWTILLDENGQQLINTVVPFGTALPPPVARQRVQRVLQSGQTLVSGLIPGPVTKKMLSTLNVPATTADGKRYVVAAVFEASFFERRLKDQKIPADWIIGLIDQDGKFIARTLGNGMAGQQAKPELVAAARQSDTGQIRHVTLNNVESYDVFLHSRIAGWTIAVAAPVNAIEASARNAIMVASLGLVAAIASAAIAAIFFGGYLFRSINQAAFAAASLGQGRAPKDDKSSVQELQQLHDAIGSAAQLIAEEKTARLLAEGERSRLMASEILARKHAEMENEAKDQFLAMLGHEIRNPLSAIHTAAALIGNEVEGNQRIARAREILDRQSHNLSKIVDDLLDVTRVSMGKVELRREPVDLGALTRFCLDGLAAAGRTADRHVNADLRSVWVDADRTRLEQVVNNLLINAIKYTQPDGRIDVTVHAGADKSILTIRDSGIGIAPHLLPKIFDLFVQAPASLARTQGGLGIGLTLVKQLVVLHGGAVDAQSGGLGHGSVFSVTLPRCAPPEPTRRHETPAAPAEHYRILLIDDNDDGREMIAMALATHGHEVLEAENGDDGIRIVTLEKPEVAVIDIGLPGMSGFEVARHLRASAEGEGMRLVALTGYGQESDRERSIAAGFDAHLVKPVNIAELLDNLKK